MVLCVFVMPEAKRSEAEGVAKTETKNRDAEGMRSDRRERSFSPKAGRCANKMKLRFKAAGLGK
jgi:hypothetical protein